MNHMLMKKQRENGESHVDEKSKTQSNLKIIVKQREWTLFPG